MLSFTLAIALAVPRGVSVLRVVLRAVPGGARLLRDIRPRRPRQQHPHFASGIRFLSDNPYKWYQPFYPSSNEG